MDRHLIREGPHHGARLGITKRCTTVLDGHPLDAAGQIGLPVLALGKRLFIRAQVIPPAEFLENVGGEFRVTVLDLGTLAPGVFGQQVDAVALHAEAGTEIQPAARHRFAGVIQVGVPGCCISAVPQQGQGKP